MFCISWLCVWKVVDEWQFLAQEALEKWHTVYVYNQFGTTKENTKYWWPEQIKEFILWNCTEGDNIIISGQSYWAHESRLALNLMEDEIKKKNLQIQLDLLVPAAAEIFWKTALNLITWTKFGIQVLLDRNKQSDYKMRYGINTFARVWSEHSKAEVSSLFKNITFDYKTRLKVALLYPPGVWELPNDIKINIYVCDKDKATWVKMWKIIQKKHPNSQMHVLKGDHLILSYQDHCKKISDNWEK